MRGFLKQISIWGTTLGVAASGCGGVDAPTSSAPEHELFAHRAIGKLTQKNLALWSQKSQQVFEETSQSPFRICSNNYKTKLWGQLVVEADLMNDELSRLQLNPSHTAVAVLDTGFDLRARKFDLDPRSSLRVFSGHERAGRPDLDEQGHGTMVSSLITGRDGVGVAPHLSLGVFRVTSAGAMGSASGSDITSAIRAACTAGYEVINLSFASKSEESGRSTFEETNKDLLTFLAEKGCLLVHAAGNDSYRLTNAASIAARLDDPVLLVEATNPLGETTAFSSLGEVTAPGSDVFTLTSSSEPLLESDHEKIRHDCDRDLGRFVSGTSFAAPIVTGIAGEVIGVLKLKGIWTKLAGADRIRLLTRPLKASENSGSISGLRAVKMAELVNLPDLQQKFPSPDDLKNLLVQHCHENPSAPSSTLAPLAQNIQNARVALSLCASPESIPTAIELTGALSFLQTAELAHFTFERLQKLAAHRNIDLAPAALTLWQLYRRQWSVFGPSSEIILLKADVVTHLLPEVLNSSRPLSEAEISNFLQTFLTSLDLEERLSKRPGRGSEKDLAKTIDLLTTVSSTLSSPAFSATLDSWYSLWAHAIEPLFLEVTQTFIYSAASSILTPARILNGLIESSAFSTKKVELLALEEKFFKTLNKTEVILGPLEGPYDSQLPFSDQKNLHLAYLTPFVRRHALPLNEPFERSASSLSAPVIAVLLKESPLLIPPETDRLRDVVFQNIAAGKGWSESNDRVLLDIVWDQWAQNLEAQILPPRVVTSQNRYQSFWKPIESARSSVVILQSLGSSVPLIFRDPELQTQAALRIANGLLHQDEPYLRRNLLSLSFAFDDLGTHLVNHLLDEQKGAPALSLNDIRFPRLPLSAPSRRSPPAEIPLISFKPLPADQTLEALFEKAVALHLQYAKEEDSSAEPLFSLLSRGTLSLRATLLPGGKALAALSTLAKKIARNPARYDAIHRELLTSKTSTLGSEIQKVLGIAPRP